MVWPERRWSGRRAASLIGVPGVVGDMLLALAVAVFVVIPGKCLVEVARHPPGGVRAVARQTVIAFATTVANGGCGRTS